MKPDVALKELDQPLRWCSMTSTGSLRRDQAIFTLVSSDSQLRTHLSSSFRSEPRIEAAYG